MDDFLTPADVSKLTGSTVDASLIVQAAGVIELYAGRPTEVWRTLRPRDRRCLKQATAYQAAWMKHHPETFTAMDVTHFQQLDQRVDPRTSDSITLSPLARRALKRLSWRGIRSVPLTSDFQRPVRDWDHEGHWSPLP